MPNDSRVAGGVVRLRLENIGIHAEIDRAHIAHAPVGQHLPEARRRHQRRLELIVDLPDVAPRQIHDKFRRRPPEEARSAAQISLGKMRMIKPDHRNAERCPEAIAFHAT